MSEKKNDHPLQKAAAGVTAAAAAAYGGISYYIFRQAFDAENSTFSAYIQKDKNNSSRNETWLMKSSRIDDTIQSYDGLTLHGVRIVNHVQSHRWVVFLHGFRGCWKDMLDYAWEADRRGYNVFLPDSRAFGVSKGRYTGLGWPEHYDLITWLAYLIDKDPKAEIALCGVSMGASAVIHAVGEYLPANVTCAIEDSGYANIRKELIYVVSHASELPSAAFIPGVDFYTKMLVHYSIYEVDGLKQLAQSRTPMLFIYGKEDSLVPASMAVEAFDACASEKEIRAYDNCGHAAAYNQPGYFDELFDYIGKHMREGVKTEEKKTIETQKTA